MGHVRCDGGRGQGVWRIVKQRSTAVCTHYLKALCAFLTAMHFTDMVELTYHSVQATSPALQGAGADEAAASMALSVEVSHLLEKGAIMVEWHQGIYSR